MSKNLVNLVNLLNSVNLVNLVNVANLINSVILKLPNFGELGKLGMLGKGPFIYYVINFSSPSDPLPPSQQLSSLDDHPKYFDTSGIH